MRFEAVFDRVLILPPSIEGHVVFRIDMKQGTVGMAQRIHLLIGCTASGKSRVGLEIARRLGTAIISIDSMKIYRRMDIGTAKPSAEVRREIPHHLIDVVEPSDAFSVARYLELADEAIRNLAACGLPVLAVGGTMLYVRGLTAGVFEGPGADPDLRSTIRRRAEQEGTAALHAELAKVDPVSAERIHPNDLRRIERALEVYRLTGTPISRLQTQWVGDESPYECRLVALRRPKEEENKRINARVKRMIDAGLVEEVRGLLAEPAGIGEQAAQAVGYAEIIAHLRGEMTFEEAAEKIKINSRRLAKSQRTWMKRMPDIHWVEVADEDRPEQLAARVLAAFDL